MYCEPHSSLAAFLYLLFSPRCQLLIHYHEYRDLEEYRHPGNRIMAAYHWIERRFLYKRATWISHTNDDRVQMFLEDERNAPPHVMRSLPNLPPKAWRGSCKVCWPTNDEILKLVYVGALSRRDTFIEPLVEWIRECKTLYVQLDLFVNNIDIDTRRYLEANGDARIQFHDGGIPYDQLPTTLSDYHVGLVLYRGNTRNYVFNAPNKLFEYLACGLDVWYPDVMLGVKPYSRTNVFPRVVEVDFENMDAAILDELRSRAGLLESPWMGSCEAELAKLEAEMREAEKSRN